MMFSGYVLLLPLDQPYKTPLGPALKSLPAVKLYMKELRDGSEDNPFAV